MLIGDGCAAYLNLCQNRGNDEQKNVENLITLPVILVFSYGYFFSWLFHSGWSLIPMKLTSKSFDCEISSKVIHPSLLCHPGMSNWEHSIVDLNITLIEDHSLR